MLTNELPRSREITHKPLLNSKRGFVNHHFKSSSVHFNRPSLLWGVILSFVKLFLQGDVDLQQGGCNTGYISFQYVLSWNAARRFVLVLILPCTCANSIKTRRKYWNHVNPLRQLRSRNPPREYRSDYLCSVCLIFHFKLKSHVFVSGLNRHHKRLCANN